MKELHHRCPDSVYFHTLLLIIYLSAIERLICRREISLIGSTSFGFAQNTIHDFQNTVLNSYWHCLRQTPQKLTPFRKRHPYRQPVATINKQKFNQIHHLAAIQRRYLDSIATWKKEGLRRVRLLDYKYKRGQGSKHGQIKTSQFTVNQSMYVITWPCRQFI